jgi:hypothetical protein
LTIQTALNQLFSNVGIGFGDFFLLLAIAVSVLFMVASFRIGLSVLLILNTLLFVSFTLIGMPNYNALIALIFSGTILAASLFFKTEGSG